MVHLEIVVRWCTGGVILYPPVHHGLRPDKIKKNPIGYAAPGGGVSQSVLARLRLGPGPTAPSLKPKPDESTEKGN